MGQQLANSVFLVVHDRRKSGIVGAAADGDRGYSGRQPRHHLRRSWRATLARINPSMPRVRMSFGLPALPARIAVGVGQDGDIASAGRGRLRYRG